MNDLPVNIQVFIKTLPADKQAKAIDIALHEYQDASISHLEWTFYNSNGKTYDLKEADVVGWDVAFEHLKEWVACYQTLERMN